MSSLTSLAMTYEVSSYHSPGTHYETWFDLLVTDWNARVACADGGGWSAQAVSSHATTMPTPFPLARYAKWLGIFHMIYRKKRMYVITVPAVQREIHVAA